MAEKKKAHKYSHTHQEHHKDGSITIHHVHESDPSKDVKHAVANLDGAHDSMEDHLGTPNPGEAAAEAGEHGVPAAQAASAGLPAPPPVIPSGA